MMYMPAKKKDLKLLFVNPCLRPGGYTKILPVGLASVITYFKENGYNSYVFGQKSYNGVAFLSKCKITNVKNDLIKDKLKQSRIITGEILVNKKKIKLINIYVPNGNPIDSEK